MAVCVAAAFCFGGAVERSRTGTGRRRHGARNGEGSDRRRDAGRRRRRSAMPVSGFTRTTTTDAGGQVHRSATCRPIAITCRSRRRVSRRSSATSTSEAACRSPSTCTLTLAGATSSVEVVGHAEDLTRARSDRAHRHRSEPDREAAARILVGAQPGDHARVARRRLGLERVLPSDRRSRADAVLDRQPAGHRSAEPRLLEPDLARRGAVDGDHHRRRAGRVRRQEQPRRAHRDQVRPRSAEADRQRGVRLRLVQEPVVRGQPRRRLARDSATFCRSAACGPIASSIRRSSRRCTIAGDSLSFFNRLDAHAGDTSTFHLNLQAARSSFDVPNTFDQNDAGQAQHQEINTFNVAPGYSQVIGSKTLFTANGFVRQDHLTYTPSADPFADQPASVSQDRTLTNIGVKADVVVHDRRAQREAGRHDQRDAAGRALHDRLHRSRRSTRHVSTRRRPSNRRSPSPVRGR